MTTPADPLARQWSRGPRPRIYDFTIQHRWLFTLLSRVVWASDVRAFYDDVAALGRVPDGTSILDVPCGGGVAFRGLRPDGAVRYVAADVSPLMLDRARNEATRRGLTSIEFEQTDVLTMPFKESTFDLCVCYNGLHCFSDPPAAVSEIARVLRPGGEFRGTVVVSGGGFMAARAVAFFQRTDQFGTVGSIEDVRGWLEGGGLVDVQLRRQGAYVSFSGRRGAAT